MTRLPVEIYPVAAVRDVDRAAIETQDIPGYLLMTRAAEAAFEAARKHFAGRRRWQFVAGPGNNGGDAWVMARLAYEAGVPVDVVSLTDPEALSGDARRAWQDYIGAGGDTLRWSGSLDTGAGLLIDGLLGSGLERPVSGEFLAVIDAMNAHRAPVFALDMPSGIHGDSGQALGGAVRAAVTMAFVGLKPGYFLAAGIDAVGQLLFANLGVPAACYDRDRAVLRRVGTEQIAAALGRRRRNAHKGDFGHVLVVGGSPGMSGAALLAGRAALAVGAGRVSVATHPSHAAALVAACPELMVRGVADSKDLAPLLEAATVAALGPGLDEGQWGDELCAAVGRRSMPVVCDAGALARRSFIADPHDDRILTPHPGEAGRLLGLPAHDVQRDRLAALRQLVEDSGSTVVLKGAASLIGRGTDLPWLVADGNPGMASAGMGDVLTGVIAGLRAQGLDAEQAAAVGTAIHARAGDRAAEAGERGLMASDVITALRPECNPC